jgi:hypothetical protein
LLHHDDRAANSAAEWLTVATLVEHAGMLPGAENAELLHQATDLALAAIGDAAMERLAASEWGNIDRSPLDAIIVLTDAMQQA